MKTNIIHLAVTLLTLMISSIQGEVIAADSPDDVARQDALPKEIRLDSSAQLNKGIAAYNRGDYVEAFRLFRNISVLGEPEALYRLGVMYADGLGTRKSAALATYWLKLAAKQNHPGAEAALARLKPGSISG